MLKNIDSIVSIKLLCFGPKAKRLVAKPRFYCFIETGKCATTDKENLRGVHLDHFLMGMLSAASWWHIAHRTLNDFQQGLLNALARNITSYAWIFTPTRDLVDLIDVNDAPFCKLNIAVGGVEQIGNDSFHIFANVARFGKTGGIRDGEWHIQHARQGLSQKCFSRARRSNQ